MTPTPCPHGNHSGGTRPHDELRQVCLVCGGPRVAAGAPTTGSEIEPLKQARRAVSRRRAWRLTAGLGAVVGALDASIGLAIAFLFGGIGFVSGGFLAMALPFALLFLVGLARSAGFSGEIGARVAEAWKNAARDVAVGAGHITAAELAKTLGASESEAERWLAELTASDALRSEVTDEGQVAYSSSSAELAANPVRIDTEIPDAAEPTDEEAELEARFAELARREAKK